MESRLAALHPSSAAVLDEPIGQVCSEIRSQSNKRKHLAVVLSANGSSRRLRQSELRMG